MDVNRTLNLPALNDRLIRSGLNQAQLADKLNVSREAVSKWFSGESFPTPDKLIRIGVLLRAGFDDIVITPPPIHPAPVVYYRKKASRKTKPEDLEKAQRRGELLRRLVPYLPAPRLTRPPTLQNPRRDYSYIQEVAAIVRRQMNIADGKPLDFKDVIDKFTELNAVIVPVLWGAQVEHGNALNVYLPDSGTTWVFLNLDSNAVDFKFWMAHELGHSLAPEMGEEEGEPFADAFAQALLFPDKDAANLRHSLSQIADIGRRITLIKKIAEERVISPLTIRYALHAYEEARGLPKTALGEIPSFMGAVKNFGKGYTTVAQALFGDEPPAASQFIAKSASFFHTPIFDALAAFGREKPGAEHFIHSALGLSFLDSKAIASELRA